MKNLIEQVADIAMEVDREYPLDFAMLEVDEREFYEKIAANVLELYLSTSAQNREMVLLGTCTQLIVENFILNTRNEQH